MAATRIDIQKKAPVIEAPDVAVVETRWQKETVPLEALERTLYAIADRATGAVSDSGDHWRLELHVQGHVHDLDGFAHAVRREVNDQTLRVRIAERTDAVRNLVFALAFSRTGLVESAVVE